MAVSLCCYRFGSASSMCWAFSQMLLARAPLAACPDIGFFKLFGSGSGESFHPRPNFGVYAIMATWPSVEHAREQVESAHVFQRYAHRADEHVALFFEPVYARGEWDGRQPFALEGGRDKAPTPIAVVTRATIRPAKALRFWRSVPAVSDAVASAHAPLFKLGLGEVPWFQQVTFSVWPDMASMRDFAYASGPHREVIARVREGGWFKEDLYARFSVAHVDGHWADAADDLYAAGA